MHIHKQIFSCAKIIILFFFSFCLVSGCGNKNSIIDNSIHEDTLVVQEQEPEPTGEMRKILTVADARTFIDTSSNRQAYMNGIIPQMLEDAPEYAIKLLANTHDRFIVVDKYRMKVILFNKYGVEEESYGMACAKNFGTKHKKADSRTPEGFFSVQGVYDSTDWLFTDDDGVTSDKKGQFGPRFIRLNIPITYQIGIHGTCAPWSIGARTSHGCIRITNENILHLVELVDSGMPVIVTPGRRDMGVNREEGYRIPAISTIVGKKAPTPIDVRVPEKDSQKNDSTSVSEGSDETTPEKHPEETLPAAEPQREEPLQEQSL